MFTYLLTSNESELKHCTTNRLLQVLARTQNWLKRDSNRNTGVRKNRQSDLKHATADQHGNTGGQEIGPYRWTINTTDKNTVNRDRKHGLPKCRSVTEQQNNNNWQTKSDPPIEHATRSRYRVFCDYDDFVNTVQPSVIMYFTENRNWNNSHLSASAGNLSQ